MHARRITFIAVIAVVIFAVAAVVMGADQPQASFSPDHILKGTAPTITITLDKSIPNQKQISSVRVGGQVAAMQKPREEGKLSVLLPKLNILGRADVEVIGKGDKLVAVGQLNYVESAEQSSQGITFLWLYVGLIVALPLICTIYDIYKSYKERSTVLSKLPANADIAEIKALLVDMDQGPSGLTGLTRGIVTVTIILILGFAVFHLVVFAPTVPHVAEQLLTLLGGTLTAITGFYFGTKAATAATPPTKSDDGKPVS
ncbi:MAG TPA: hypothetical protein VI298_10850 [Geobacteraceae bacterium]